MTPVRPQAAKELAVHRSVLRRPLATRPARTVVVGVTALTTVVGLGLGGSGWSAQAGSAVPTVTGDARVDTLLSQLTLDEKLTLIEGQAEAASPDKQYQAGYLPGIPRLGIPSLKLTDGPPGVITRQDSTGMTATMGV